MVNVPPLNQPVDFMNSALMQMERLTGNQTFTWNGETFICIPNSLNHAGKSIDAGFADYEDFRMTVRLNQFSPNIYPDVEQHVTYMGTDLIIDRILKTDTVAWAFICRNPNL